MKQIDVNGLPPDYDKVLMDIKENPTFSIKELSLFCNFCTTKISLITKELK